MSEVVLNGGKDQLSHLPNEILQHIFDQAYHPYRRSGALISKRFLPFYESNLYRDIRIENPSRLSCLLRTLTDRPALSLRTESVEFELYTNFTYMDSMDPDQFLRLLSFLPNLRILSTEWCLTLPATSIPQSVVSKLRSVDLPVSAGADYIVRPQILSWIASTPSISKLRLSHWYVYDELEDEINWVLPHVKKLEIAGFGVTDPQVTAMINSCTSLESLGLWSTPGSGDPETYEEVLTMLDPVSTSLTSLSLSSVNQNVSIGESLASFPFLRHLELEGLDSLDSLDTALAELGYLVHLDISNIRDFDWDTLVPLLRGPSRLPNLRKLSLGSIYGKIGRRFDPSDPLLVAQFEMVAYDDWAEWKTWELCRHPPSYWIKLRQVADIARRSGILINDSFEKSLQIVSAYLLEINNLAIASAYYHMNLHGIPKARKLARDFGLELPELDFGSPYPDEDDTELIKVDMKGTGWFALTLKDKMQKDADDEEEEGEKE
ncbi:hypothetical protein JCM5353_004704 [Sporobolomyces roseus]